MRSPTHRKAQTPENGIRQRNLMRWAGWLALMSTALCGGWITPCAAETGTLREYELKAGVLFNIIKYVEWPDVSSASNAPAMEIGLLGQIPFADALEVLNGKSIQGRKLVVKRVASLAEAQNCQVVFISGSEKARLGEIITELRNRPVLTVGEVEGFAERGGIVNLVAGPNRIVMEINREVAGQSRLTISSQLLKLAKVFPK